MNTKSLKFAKQGQLLFLVVLIIASTPLSHQQNCSARLARPDSVIPTTTLSPTPISVSLADLPRPYATESASKPARVNPVPENASLNVPNGFSVNVFETDLTTPRWLALTPNDEVLVTETSLNRISILIDEDNDGVVDVNEIFAGPANGLNQVFGMLFTEGFFYIANTNEIRRYPYVSGQRRINGTGERIANLSSGGHWTRNIILSPDGQQIYVSIGSRSNVGVEPSNRASIWSMNLDGSNQTLFASGLRNPVGLALHPVTQELYTTVNERDGLGDDLVPDYFTRVQEGQFFGWPYAYLSPDNLDPRELADDGSQSLNPELAASTVTPDVLFESHSAPLGLKFYTGDTFPELYRNGAFVAFHGSWNRDRGTGYKVVFIPFDENNRPLGYYTDFVTGFLDDPVVPSTWGRPTGLLVLRDGSLIFTEEDNGRIYRIQYQC